MVRRPSRLTILECISDTKEKLCEGSLMWELMRILGFEEKTTLKHIGGPKRLIKEIKNTQDQFLHISAHGNFSKTKGTYFKTLRKGRVYSTDLNDIWLDKKRSEIPRLVILSACEAGHIDMIRSFSDAGCKFCVAPLHGPDFEDAAVFLTVFYKLLIGERRSPWIAYKNTIDGLSQSLPKLTGAWSFYEWGEKCFIVDNE